MRSVGEQYSRGDVGPVYHELSEPIPGEWQQAAGRQSSSVIIDLKPLPASVGPVLPPVLV